MRAPQPSPRKSGPRTLALGALALAIGVTLAGAARADPGADQTQAATVEWNDAWARFRPWEYAATGAIWTGGLLLRFVGPPLNRERGTFIVDDRFTSWVTLNGGAKDVASIIADIGYVGSIAYRLFDSTIVPGLFWGNSDVMLQMTLIDVQAFGLSAFVLWSAQLAYGRERPLYRSCPNAPESVDCSDPSEGRYRAFIAGHTLIASTAAGLTCVHHAHLPLYGGGTADTLACAGMIGVAALVGIGRMTGQAHYLTDTVLAWGLGAVFGYVVPSALHYGFDRAPSPDAGSRRHPERAGLRLALAPGASTTPAGFTLAGTF